MQQKNSSKCINKVYALADFILNEDTCGVLYIYMHIGTVTLDVQKKGKLQ